MTFYNPLAFIFAFILPCIVILYLLRQKHQDYQVSSIRLWQDVLRDIEANAPWQKLKRNLLMFLQLAAMLLLVLALARPFINTPGGRAGHVIIVLDTSFSMQAEDTKPSRFEAAKKKAARYITNLKPGTLITLVNMGSSTIIEENLSNEKSKILDKLNGIKVSNESENREETASLVETMLKQQSAAEVVCFSDSPLNIKGIKTGFYNAAGNGVNYAVAGLSHVQTDNGITVLGRIANYTGTAADIPVSLYVDGKVFDARIVRVAGMETGSVYWNRVPLKAQQLECRLDLQDDLKADNSAWSVVNRIKARRAILVSNSNIFLEKALSLISGIQLLKTGNPSDTQLKGYDLYIFDGMLPDKLPEDGSILVFDPPAGKLFKMAAAANKPVLQDAGHLLMKYVDLSSFNVAKSKIFVVPEWGKPVISSGAGTVAFAGTDGKKRIMAFGFDLHQSDLPVTNAFPIMMTNILEWLVPADVKNIEDIYPGKAVEFNLNPKTSKASVITPRGNVYKIAPPFPAGLFSETDEIGKYTLVQESPQGTVKHYFTVNAPAALESDISAGNKASGGKSGNISRHNAETGFNLQNMLLWAVLLFLCLEWWVYSHGI